MTLYLVIGPPASGKTTWVKQRARHGDITIDYDAIASVLTPPGADIYDQPDAVKAVTKAARQAAIDAAVKLSRLVDVYIIHAMPSDRLIAEYRQRGAQIITVDPGRDVVMARCKTDRPWRMAQAAKQWYATKTGRQSDDQPTIELGQLSETW